MQWRVDLPRTLFVCLLFFPFIHGCDPFASEDTDYLAQARLDMEDGRPNEAIIALKNGLQIQPDDASARLLLGQLEMQRGNWQAAIKELNKAQELGISPTETLLLLAQAYLETGEHERMLLELQPSNFQAATDRALALNLRAAAMVALGKLDQADATYQEALALQSKNIDATIGRGTVASLRGDFDAARALFDTALTIDPDKLVAWILVGDLEFRRHNLDASEAAYRRALQLDPKSFKAKLGLAAALLGRGDKAQAQALMGQIGKGRRNAPRYKLLQASLEYDNKDFRKVRDLLEPVIAARPDFDDGKLLLGAAYFASGQYQQAQTLLKEFLEKRPWHQRARLLLASAQAEAGLEQRAINTLRPALEQAGSREALFAVAQLHLMAGERQVAKQYIEKLLDQYADGDQQLVAKAQSQAENLHLTSSLRSLEQAETERRAQQQQVGDIIALLEQREYRQALRRLKALDPQRLGPSMESTIKAVAHAGMAETTLARKEFADALSANPDNLVALMGAASIDLRDGKLETAASGFERVLVLDPLNRRAALALARIAGQQGDQEGHWAALDRARALDPSNVEPALSLARLHLDNGRLEQGERTARIAYALQPGDGRSRRLLAEALMRTGDQVGAVRLLEGLIAEPLPLADDRDGLSQRGRDRIFLAALLDETGRREQALKTLRDGIGETPRYLPLYTALVGTWLRHGNSDKALAVARELQAAQPQSPDGYALEGDVRRSQGDYPGAIAAYRQALPLAATGRSARSLAVVLYAANQTDRAKAVLSDRLEAAPDDIETRVRLASLTMAAGDPATAREGYLRVLRDQPAHPVALNQLALLEQREGDVKSALEYARRANQAAPAEPLIADTLGWLLVQSDQLAAGLRLLRAANQALPDHPVIRYHLAAALAQDGDKQGALDLLKGLPLDRPSFEQRDAAAALLDRLGGSGR